MRGSDYGRLVESFLKDKSLADAFKCLFENASDAIYILDMHGNFVAVNHKAEELTGFKREDFIGKSFRKIIPAKSLPKTIKGFLSVIRGKSIRLKLELKTAFKKTVPVEVTSTPLIINGKIVGTLGIARDITEREKAEKALRESEGKYRALMEKAPIGICNVDIKGKITYVNKRFEEVSGYSREEVVGKNGFKLGMFSHETLKLFTERIKERLMGKPIRRLEVRFKCKDGRWIWVEIEGRIIKKRGIPVGFQLASRDITKRKQMEEKLKMEKEKFQTLFNLMVDPVVIVDSKGKFLEITNRVKEITGYEKEELLGKNFFRTNILTARSKAVLIKNLAKRMIGTHVAPYEIEVLTKDGEKLPFEVNAIKITYEGKPADMVAFHNLRERKKAEKAVRESQEKFERLFMNNPEAAVYTDSGFHILDLNSRFTELFGYSLDEVKGKRINDMVVPKGKMEEAGMLDRKARKGYVRHDTVRKRKDGTLVPVSVSAAPITVENQLIGSVALYKDITERRQMEKKLEEYSEHLEELVEKRTKELKKSQEQLLKSERLAVVGELAAMVGHDLRNPFTGIAGATYYLKMKLGSKMDKKSREMLELIEKNVEYSNKIISDLLEYSREIRLEPAETTPKSIIKGALILVKVPKNIRILDLTGNEPKIKVDVEKMKRVFVNTVKNAVDAMPKGGKLTIKSKETNGKLQISFTDTGMGVPEDVLDKIWTPLFTTKAKGIGLGLSVCKRIVEAHGGNVSVESTVGKGTTFTATIPIKPKLEGGENVWVNVPESLLSTTTKA